MFGYIASTASGARHAFIWSAESGMVDLGTLGGDVSLARAVNEAGQALLDAAVAISERSCP